MNFFADQAKAKSNTTKMVLMLVLAVTALIAITQIFLVTLLSWHNHITFEQQTKDTNTLVGIALIVIGVVFLGWLNKSKQLSEGGGKAIAETLGGQAINNHTSDNDERKILNVVEEMAIASGISVPPVYLIEQYGINAFAAGHSPKDAIIGITRGCIRSLDRDELQGVVAHEFSHIFNGDIRLNTQLISLVYGIEVIGIIGEQMLFGQDDDWGQHQWSPIFIIPGTGLFVIGYLGAMFANLIRVAVTWQREFLADATAVQFTRNPEGISNALKKIGGYPIGSSVFNPHTKEFSHIFFSQAIKNTDWIPSHPSIEERIKRIEPNRVVRFIKVELPDDIKINPYFIDHPRTLVEHGTTITSKNNYNEVTHSALSTSLIVPTTVLQSIGVPSSIHIDEARKILDGIPDNINAFARNIAHVVSIVYCLLLEKQRADILEQQLQSLKEKTEPEVYKDVIALKESVATLSVKFRLPLIDICMPTLKQLSPAQYQAFKKNMLMLIQADNKVDLFEWSLYRIVVGHLENTPARTSGKYNTFDALQSDCQRLISAVALKNAKVSSEAPTLFTQGWKETGLPATALVDNALTDINALNTALKRANTLHPLKKPQLIKACCAALKDHTQAESIELIRAIADGLDVPMPPLLAGQTLC